MLTILKLKRDLIRSISNVDSSKHISLIANQSPHETTQFQMCIHMIEISLKPLHMKLCFQMYGSYEDVNKLYFIGKDLIMFVFV